MFMVLLGPQKAPRSVTLSVNNASCVTLTWSPPEWPNGDITRYEVSLNISYLTNTICRLGQLNYEFSTLHIESNRLVKTTK